MNAITKDDVKKSREVLEKADGRIKCGWCRHSIPWVFGGFRCEVKHAHVPEEEAKNKRYCAMFEPGWMKQ